MKTEKNHSRDSRPPRHLGKKSNARHRCTPDRVLELCHTQGVTYCEVDSDAGGVVRYPAEEFRVFRLPQRDGRSIR